ncbi:hypothetical protein CSV72_02135 [Sporosarcina sp. P20a]|uniref:hypothetical protein n=1 Tax=Sporosarcina sp. P20a TaxID=2048256 RepID=UPI000C16C631|nr:hypothetical protein [Sporosarcina sp. P20a]PIC87969.1 hypothetical protein CSV72_02135 [Sporosarcina sp. P20a]
MSDIQRDPETEAFIETQEHADLFRFMRDVFESLEDYDIDYDPEVDDPLAAMSAVASDKFEIPHRQAMDIYVDIQNKLTEHLLKLRGSNKDKL